MFLLYTGIPILLSVSDTNNEYLEHFTYLHVAIRFLCSGPIDSDTSSYVEKLLKHFVVRFGELYSEQNISYNVHSVIH